MANLTLTIDAEILKRARIRALEEDTSVNALVREFLEGYAAERRERFEVLDRILEDVRKGGAGSEGRKFNREEIYEERTRWPRRKPEAE